jgi:hypothetical protein
VNSAFHCTWDQIPIMSKQASQRIPQMSDKNIKIAMDEKIIIPIYRGGSIVSSLGNSFGGSLRETRLTAIIGYLISLAPTPFLNLFDIEEIPVEINLELSEENGRSDIQLVTGSGIAVIEAKITSIDPIRQAQRYNAKWRVLLTNYKPGSHVLGKKTRYITWQDIANVCSGLCKNPDYRVKFLSQDVILYLKEHKMIKRDDMVEIYAREINEEKTLALFLHGRLYGCDFKRNSSIGKANYFAPHFGQNIANLHPGISVGISYVAQIESIEIVESIKDVKNIIRKNRGQAWLKKNMYLVQPILSSWPWKNVKRNFLFLGEPRLVFNPAVKKELLQKGKGWLGKQYLTFDELFKAWSGKSLY